MEVKGKYKPQEPCPCCDYVTLPDRGSYFICPICFWEDDGMDIDNLDEYCDPNHMTLREARRNFKEFGACEKEMLKNVISIEAREAFIYKPRNI